MKKLKSSPPSELPQSTRFIEAARAAGASEDEAVFDANLKQIAKAKIGFTAEAEIKKPAKQPRG